MYGAFGRDFATSDGRRVMVVAISLNQWQTLVRATGVEEHLPAMERAFDADFRKEEDRYRARDAIAALLTPWFEARTLDEIRTALDEHGVCWGPYQTFTQLLDDDWRVSEKNPVFGDVDHPGIGSLRTPASPLRFPDRSAGPARCRRRCSARTPTRSSPTCSASRPTEIGRCTTTGSSRGRPREPGRERREPTLADTGFDASSTPRPGRRPSTPCACSRRASTSIPRVLDARRAPAARGTGRASSPTCRPRDLGADGHPRRRPEMAAFPQRMWVGGRVRVARAARDRRADAERGRAASCAAELKEGCAGRFWLVTVGHTIAQGGEVCIEEEQDLVFRERRAAARRPGPTPTTRPTPSGSRSASPIRCCCSASRRVTFNAHRIHYDHPYATEVEGYPDLVVHGPLTAILLAELARTPHRPRRSATISFRARAPHFANQPFWLTGHADPTATIHTAAIRADHLEAMTLDTR